MMRFYLLKVWEHILESNCWAFRNGATTSKKSYLKTASLAENPGAAGKYTCQDYLLHI